MVTPYLAAHTWLDLGNRKPEGVALTWEESPHQHSFQRSSGRHKSIYVFFVEPLMVLPQVNITGSPQGPIQLLIRFFVQYILLQRCNFTSPYIHIYTHSHHIAFYLGQLYLSLLLLEYSLPLAFITDILRRLLSLHGLILYQQHLRKMARSLLSLMAMATACLSFATTVLAWGVPAGLATNASQITCHDPDTHSGPCLQARLKPAISAKVFDRFKLAAQYSAAAYCKGNTDNKLSLITCREQLCPLVEEAGVKTTAEFNEPNEPGKTKLSGFIAIDEKNELLVLSFRGAEFGSNWLVLFGLTRHPTHLCEGCSAHEAFWRPWMEVKKQVKDEILRLRALYPAFRFIVTGHSFGGAAAILAAGDLRTTNRDLYLNTELYTFGAPRVSNLALTEFLSDQSLLSYRITNHLDPVPRLPSFHSNFFSTEPEFQINRNSAHPSQKDFLYYEGINNPHGSSMSGNPIWGWPKHKSYFFEDITLCGKQPGDD